MKPPTVKTGDFDECLVTGSLYPYTESRVSKSPKETDQFQRELKSMGCKRIRVIQIPQKSGVAAA